MIDDLARRLDEPGGAEDALLAAGGIVLLAEAEDAAGRLDLPVGEFARLAVARFIARADDEDWATLISSMNRSDAPAEAALATILRRAACEVREAFQ